MELGIFTGHFPSEGKGFGVMNVISDPFFLIMWFCSTRSSFVWVALWLAEYIFEQMLFPKLGS